MKLIGNLVYFGASLCLSSCYAGNGYFAVGAGHKIHICGQVVDENLKPIHDSLRIEMWVRRPLLDLKGNNKNSEYAYTVMNSKFCLTANFAEELSATIYGKNIKPSGFFVSGMSLHRSQYKWVVERDTNASQTPIYRDYGISIDTLGASWGFSISRERIKYSDGNNTDGMFSEHWLKDLFKMVGRDAQNYSTDSLFAIWDSLYPGSIVKKEWYPIGGTWTINNPKLLLDYHLQQKGDSLYFVPGPLVKTKFAVATLDTPICNFGRMPPPPSIGDPAWRDTILVAVSDSVVLDGFYVHFPWMDRWGKAVLDRKVHRKKSKTEIKVTHVFAKVGETKPFSFWTNDEKHYANRSRCRTKVDSLVATKYPIDHRAN